MGAVAIAMLFISIIWLLSIGESFKSISSQEENPSNIRESFVETSSETELPSLENLLDENNNFVK